MGAKSRNLIPFLENQACGKPRREISPLRSDRGRIFGQDNVRAVSRTPSPGQRNLGTGTVRVIVGNICNADNRIIDTGGLVVVRRGGAGVGNTTVSHGAFEIYDLANGTYNLQFQNPGYGFIDRTVTLEPKRINFQPR